MKLRFSNNMEITIVLLVILLFHPKSFETVDLDLCDTDEMVHKTMYKYDASTSLNCNCTENCIRLCCAYGFQYKEDNCVKINDTYVLVPIGISDNIVRNVSERSAFSYGGGSECEKTPLDPSVDPDDEFFIQFNGSLWIPADNRMLSSEDYCINVGDKIVAFVCTMDDQFWQRWINNIGMLISVPFLLTILIVYSCLPERNTHMKSVMTYVLMFFIQWCLQVYDRFTDVIFFEGCRRLGFLTLTFNVASVYWMNVVCLDMWLNFRSVKGLLRAKENNKRFYYYCAYGHGLTIIHMIIVYAVDTSFKGKWFSPNVGNGVCHLRWGWPSFFYYYLSMTVIIIVNTAFFTLTTLQIFRIKSGTRKFQNIRKNKQDNQNDQYRLFIKLFLVMGINWSLDIISFLVSWLCKTMPKEVFYIVDFSNAIYGVLLFMIFVIKKSIWKSLKERHLFIRRMVNKDFKKDNPPKAFVTSATDLENETAT